MSDFLSYPSEEVVCRVSIYPFEGGQWHFSTSLSDPSTAYSGILSCTVDKNIRNPASGTFSIVLSPGGPGGVRSFPSWTEILTPMSLVVIGMSRGSEEAIVMIGFVLSATETQIWSRSQVMRAITVTGADFSYLFSTRNYFNLTWLGGPGPLITPNNPNAGFAYSVDTGLLQGTPDQLASLWYSKVMLKILDNLVFQGPSGKSVGFQQIVNYIYESYYLSSSFIPFNSNFISSTGNWMNKFLAFFPFPFYEYFVYTVSNDILINTLSGLQSTYSSQSGFSFLSAGGHDFSNTKAGPSSVFQVARLVPFPLIRHSVGANGIGTPDNIDMSLWNNLYVYTEDQFPDEGFIESEIAFSENEVSNFYTINPTQISSFLKLPSNLTTASLLMPLAYDSASVFRYGWRPQILTTEWFSTSTEQTNQNITSSIALGYDLLDQAVSYYEPTPLMARGSLVNLLSPTIFPGNIIRYYPFRENTRPDTGGAPGSVNATWDFYIEGVRHNFTFGKRSTTTLTLSRGLPTSVYGDLTLLFDILTGNAQRINGESRTLKTSYGTPLTYATYSQSLSILKNLNLTDFNTPKA
jgi:hypothetical protein